MCGIVAALTPNLQAVPILLDGLRRLEYRGYDSSGMAWSDSNKIHRHRVVGRIKELENDIGNADTKGTIGIAHTRWATHGGVTEQNAHPHLIQGSVAMVHNGIFENYLQLRSELAEKGYQFQSDTDTEVAMYLVEDYIKQGDDLVAAVQNALGRLEGAYAIAVMQEGNEDLVVGARKGSPLVVGLNEEGGGFLASDMGALIANTRQFYVLENEEMAVITRDSVSLTDLKGTPVQREVYTSALSAQGVELGEYRHYMQKEIAEQPRAIAETLEGRLGSNKVLDGILGPKADEILDQVDGVTIIACGTSSYAGQVACHWMESFGMPCSVEIASEFRARSHARVKNQLIVAITQSGETIDTISAIEHAKGLGFPWLLTICNVPESSLVRMADLVLMTHAGPEIGVASTKAFTTQLVALMLLSLLLGRRRDLTPELEADIAQQLRELPEAANAALAIEDDIRSLAPSVAQYENALFLGRGIHFPIALEGALKLKEISYIHAEAYPAGELKHGPIALIDENMPVVAVAPNDDLTEKLMSNMQEVKARGAKLYLIVDDGVKVEIDDLVGMVRYPETAYWISPMISVIPLQMLAYHVAIIRGTDVDKPRNLAKSVTVE